MKRFKPLQIGSVEPYSGDLSRWYLKNNYSYGTITATITDGPSIVTLSDIAQSDGKWSLQVTGIKAGRAKITVTGTTTSGDAVRKFTFDVEVKDKAKLRPGQAYQLADYR